MIRKTLIAPILCFLSVVLFSPQATTAQQLPKEEDYYPIYRVNPPEGVLLEIGGICSLPGGEIAVCTRHGEIYIIQNPSGIKPYFKRFAYGLHEPLGIAYKEGSFYCVQRGELTKMTDTNDDGEADVYETVASWPLSGNHHEYSYGPLIDKDGNFFVSLNISVPLPDWFSPRSLVPWRGWAFRITPAGEMQPWSAGMRSPCGISMIDGELFYADNQGDWVGSGGFRQVKQGSFMGHPESLVWTKMSGITSLPTYEEFFSKMKDRHEKDANGKNIMPENIPNEKLITQAMAKDSFPSMQLPAIWLPHGVLGVSTTQAVKIPDGVLQLFAGQILIGDQGQSKIMRMFMETVNGELQGCAWDFRSGFQCGIVRMDWGSDGSLFVGETNRGWGSAGGASEGLERLVWNNKMPFEMTRVKAMPDGFEIEFTKPVIKSIAEDLASYQVESFTYKYHGVYGSPEVDKKRCNVKGVKVAKDGMSVRLIVENLRRHYIHTITLAGIRDLSKLPLLHPAAYYTLHNIPDGPKLSVKEVSVKNSARVSPAAKPVAVTNQIRVLTTEQIQPILVKNTCNACHLPDKKVVGPSFMEIAKRNYPLEKLKALIKQPQPGNWPTYATPMPPMANVPPADLDKIARWINSLNVKK